MVRWMVVKKAVASVGQMAGMKDELTVVNSAEKMADKMVVKRAYESVGQMADMKGEYTVVNLAEKMADLKVF